MSRRAFLYLEWGLSLVLVGLALVWAHVRALPLAGAWHVTPLSVIAGIGLGACLWLAIPLLLANPTMRRLWETALAPLARALTARDMVVIALLSGVSEELFFRGVLLPELGLLASSALFGLLHGLNRVYATWAMLTGLVFGWVALSTQTLATPIAAHATYNLGALIALRQWPVASAAPREALRT